MLGELSSKIGIQSTDALISPNPKGLGAYNLGSVRTYVRTSVDSDFSEVYGSNSLKLYTKAPLTAHCIEITKIKDVALTCMNPLAHM